MATVTVRPVKVGCEFRYSAQVPTPAVFQVQPLAEAPVSVLSGATSIEPDTPRPPLHRPVRQPVPTPRKGRILIGRGRDASDVAMTTTFGGPFLESMVVYCEEQRP